MERVLDHIDGQALSPEIVRKARPALSLEALVERNQGCDAAIQEAHSTGAYTITEIAEFFGGTPINGQPDRPPMRRCFSLFQGQRTLHDLTLDLTRPDP